jgi:DNA-binding PadR family transcriptional regulator
MIVSSEPKNGAEIMDVMETTSRGWWRPSPGSVYPMLQQLTEEGLVRRREEDGKYEITPQGREEIEWPVRMQHGGQRSVDGVISELESYVSLLEDLAQTKDSKIGEKSAKLKTLGERLSKLGTST